jgi:hypothetical protein
LCSIWSGRCWHLFFFVFCGSGYPWVIVGQLQELLHQTSLCNLWMGFFQLCIFLYTTVFFFHLCIFMWLVVYYRVMSFFRIST